MDQPIAAGKHFILIMFKLRTGYFVSGIVTGLVLFVSFLWSLPDGKLHLVFCNVGQGDAAYVRFADGKDMLIDGGPNDSVLGCLGKHMPFWDRNIDIVVLSHPQKDHMQGLIEVLRRYKVDYFVHSKVVNDTDGFREMEKILVEKKVIVKDVVQADEIDVGNAKITTVWPTQGQLALAQGQESVLGVSTTTNLNDFSVVLLLSYGEFDALFPGDADNHVNPSLMHAPLGGDPIEVLKVPHHGSKTGMTADYLTWVNPKLAVISVGKNSYGHPSPEIVGLLNNKNITIKRTDKAGDIEVVSDGKTWHVTD